MAAGCRGYEVDAGFGEAALAVSLAPAAAGLERTHRKLAEWLARSKTIRVAGPGQTEPVLVQVLLLPPRDSAGPGDAVPQLVHVKQATWAIVGGGDKLLAPPSPADAVEVVADNLEKIARYRFFLGIRNPRSDLQSKVQATLLRKSPGRDWRDALPDEQERIVFEAGDQLAFRVRHSHTDKLYLNVLDFGLTFKVSLVYPPAAGGAEVLEPLLPFVFGKREGQELTLEFPPGFDGDEGREVLKFIFATQPIDFSWMRQEGVREWLTARSLTAEDWTTLDVEFIAVRK